MQFGHQTCIKNSMSKILAIIWVFHKIIFCEKFLQTNKENFTLWKFSFFILITLIYFYEYTSKIKKKQQTFPEKQKRKNSRCMRISGKHCLETVREGQLFKLPSHLVESYLRIFIFFERIMMEVLHARRNPKGKEMKVKGKS